MKHIKTNRIVQIIYPYLIYLIIYQMGAGLLMGLYAAKFGRLMCLLMAALLCFVPLYITYRGVPKLIPEPIKDKKQIGIMALQILVVVVIGVMTNIILTHSGLIQQSQSFAKASSTLTDGSIGVMILCNGIVIPIVEELLFRGIITGQLCLWYGPIPALILSTICFGIIHNNIVQFIYAVVVGLALGLMYVKNRRLLTCIIAHGLINIIAIIFG